MNDHFRPLARDLSRPRHLGHLSVFVASPIQSSELRASVTAKKSLCVDVTKGMEQNRLEGCLSTVTSPSILANEDGLEALLKVAS